MPSDIPNQSAEGGRPLAKLLVVAVFVIIGVGAWLLWRPGREPDLSAYASASASRPAVLPLVIAVRRTPASRPGEKDKIETLRDLGQERTQTAPDTFELVQNLLAEDGHTERRNLGQVKVAATPAAAWPAANATPREIDLLAGLDLKSATVAGNWTRADDGSICSDLEQLTRLDLGYRPPAEYDLRITFTRQKGNDGIDILLYAGGRRFYWTFAGWDNTTSGFGTVLGRTVEANATAIKRPAWLKNGVRNTAVIKVRRDGVQVFLNDQRVAGHRTDYRDLNLVLRHLHRPDTIGFSTWESGYTLHDVRLIEVAGEGKRHHPPSPRPQTQPATRPSPVAAIDFYVANHKPNVYFLYRDGSVQGVGQWGQWAVAGNTIVFSWGAFIDSCELTSDRKSFAGRNQIGDAIRGTLRAGGL